MDRQCRSDFLVRSGEVRDKERTDRMSVLPVIPVGIINNYEEIKMLKEMLKTVLVVVLSLMFSFSLTKCGKGDGSGGGSSSVSPNIGTLIAINAAGDSFTMGDGTYGPNVSQTISYNFKMSQYEITNSQFQAFISESGYSTDSYWTTNGITQRNGGSWTQPSYWANSSYNGSNQPVVGVSWYEAVAFCNWLSVKEGLTPAYNANGQATLTATGYRLPTEVEWEYAAAKGGTGQVERIYAWGDATPTDCTLVAGNIGGCGNGKSENVGSKSTVGDTPQGLADMSGNVWEWCSDNYQADGSVASGTDRYYFVNDSTGQTFLVRGGAWNDTSANFFRGGYRYYFVPGVRLNSFGFRVVRP